MQIKSNEESFKRKQNKIFDSIMCCHLTNLRFVWLWALPIAKLLRFADSKELCASFSSADAMSAELKERVGFADSFANGFANGFVNGFANGFADSKAISFAITRSAQRMKRSI